MHFPAFIAVIHYTLLTLLNKPLFTLVLFDVSSLVDDFCPYQQAYSTASTLVGPDCEHWSLYLKQR